MDTKVYSGIVTRGQGAATRLGFPTVNIVLVDDSVNGVYAAKIRADGGHYMGAVFADQKRKLLEAHLLDFSGDLYGKEITIEVYEKIRDSQYFKDEQQLSAAIAEDVRKTRVILEAWKPGHS